MLTHKFLLFDRRALSTQGQIAHKLTYEREIGTNRCLIVGEDEPSTLDWIDILDVGNCYLTERFSF